MRRSGFHPGWTGLALICALAPGPRIVSGLHFTGTDDLAWDRSSLVKPK